jgi:hypothetical protein
MAGPGSVIMFGLFCCLAATWKTASGQNRQRIVNYIIDDSPVYLRGMYEMIRLERAWVHIPFLEKLNSAGSPNQQLEILKKIRQENPEGHIDNYKLDALIGFAKDDGECTRWQILLFLWVSRDSLDPKLLALKNYIKHFAASKFSKCASEALRNFPDKLESEREFDQFFTTLHQLPADTDDIQLYDKLRSANLTRNVLDYHRTKSMVLTDGDKPEAVQPVRTAMFVSKLCDHLNERFGVELGAIILSKALRYGSEEDVDPEQLLNGDQRARLLKMVKYDNMCWYLRKHWSEFQEHVEGSMGWFEMVGNIGRRISPDHTDTSTDSSD